jgi:hypothetical protein
MSTSGHTIRVLTFAELDKYARAGWKNCTTSAPCDGTAAYQADWVTSRGHKAKDRYCLSHAAQYAQRHGLSLPPLPQRPKDHTVPLPASVVARCADTNGYHGLSTAPREPAGDEA